MAAAIALTDDTEDRNLSPYEIAVSELFNKHRINIYDPKERVELIKILHQKIDEITESAFDEYCNSGK